VKQTCLIVLVKGQIAYIKVICVIFIFAYDVCYYVYYYFVYWCSCIVMQRYFSTPLREIYKARIHCWQLFQLFVLNLRVERLTTRIVRLVIRLHLDKQIKRVTTANKTRVFDRFHVWFLTKWTWQFGWNYMVKPLSLANHSCNHIHPVIF